MTELWLGYRWCDSIVCDARPDCSWTVDNCNWMPATHMQHDSVWFDSWLTRSWAMDNFIWMPIYVSPKYVSCLYAAVCCGNLNVYICVPIYVSCMCAAVCCSMLQRVAAGGSSVLQCAAVHCSVLHCAAAFCSALQCVAACCSMVYWNGLTTNDQHPAWPWVVLQHTWVLQYCNTLQCCSTATHLSEDVPAANRSHGHQLPHAHPPSNPIFTHYYTLGCMV